MPSCLGGGPTCSSRPMNWASSLVTRAYNLRRVYLLSKARANRIRSHVGGSPASACGLAGGRRLVRRYGNYSTDCRSLGVGSDRDLSDDLRGGLLGGP